MLNEIEYDIQLKNYALNNMNLKKKNEEFLNSKYPYNISSDTIDFKAYIMERNKTSIKILAKFTIINEDLKLNIEYIAEYSASNKIMDGTNDINYISSKLKPIVFLTLYKYAKQLASDVISRVTGNNTIFPIYDKRKLNKLNDR